LCWVCGQQLGCSMFSLNIFLFLENRVIIGIEHKFIKLRNVLSRLYSIYRVSSTSKHK
jgi:hypothetical protein